MMSIYNTNKHSVFLLKYHLVLAIKYRKKVIDSHIGERLREIFEQIAKKEKYQLEVVEFSYKDDYLHVSFKAQPRSEISKFINAYKSASSRLIKKEFPYIKEKLWENAFWSRSFLLATQGDMLHDDLEKYVKYQENNNR